MVDVVTRDVLIQAEATIEHLEDLLWNVSTQLSGIYDPACGPRMGYMLDQKAFLLLKAWHEKACGRGPQRRFDEALCRKSIAEGYQQIADAQEALARMDSGLDP